VEEGVEEGMGCSSARAARRMELSGGAIRFIADQDRDGTDDDPDRNPERPCTPPTSPVY